MPELPDIEVYLDCLRPRLLDQPLQTIRLTSPFLLRTAVPPLSVLSGLSVRELRRLGKRLVFRFEEDLFLVLHLMIAGRLSWKEQAGAAIPGRVGLAAFDFPAGTLLLTEAGTKRRASLHLVRGEEALAAHDPGGVEVLQADLDCFRGALTRENHTLKRALTDPHLFSGIGNAYSDEILHRAHLSPLRLSSQLGPEEIGRLYAACRTVLTEWLERLRREARTAGWPAQVTAFRPDMAVHGRYGKPCPACGSPIQRIRYAENEANYCPSCQTDGRLLADRSLSRLLRGDWPKTLEELERRRQRAKEGSR